MVVAPGDHLASALADPSVQSFLGDLVVGGSPPLPAHFGTELLAGALRGVQQAFTSVPEVQTVERMAAEATSTTAQVVFKPLGAAASGVGWQASQVAGHLAAQLSVPVQGASAHLQLVTAGLLLGPEGASLGPHWGAQAAQAVLHHASELAADATAASPDLHSVLSAAASSAAMLAQALPELDAMPDLASAPQALVASAGQLSQVLDTLSQSVAASGGLVGAPLLPADVAQVVDDLRLVLAALPFPSGASSPASWPAPVQQDAAVAEVVVRLATRVHAALQAPGQLLGGGGVPMPLGLSDGLASLALTALAVAGVSLASAALHAKLGNTGSEEDSELLSCEYDPKALSTYFRQRPVQVVRRATQVAAEAAAFGLGLLSDLTRGGLERHEPGRAEQLRLAIERLGPAYVKVAQALSTRVDLLTPEYFMQIQLLQDRVPPFPCSEARAAMEASFGRPVEDVFSSLSDKPVAAASLGQVYQAVLREDGRQVAVKVQRPGVLQQVALDLYLMRNAAILLSPRVASDWVSIMDAWALRFLREMDYETEADNAERFAQDMKGIQGIVVPKVVRSLTSSNVLTSEWVEGEKLCESQAVDVRQLCDTLLTAYLTQLLETGFLHADPHPGNLLRTPEGRIAVLDYGLMTEVTEAQRWALLEYIAHLSTQNWHALAKDLQIMGFIPESINPEESGLVEPLGRVMVQLVGGGGAAKVNIDKVMVDLENLGNSYPISIPSFFALILRAFSVIEGIALEVDPDYSIVAECFPYLARRLLADDSPRARALLRELLYGDRQRLDIERLVRLVDGFSAYTTDGLTAVAAPPRPAQADAAADMPAAPAGSSRFARNLTQMVAAPLPAREGSVAAARSQSPNPSGNSSGGLGPAAPRRPVGPDRALRDALVLIFSKHGSSYVQELLVEEVAAAVDALSARTAAALFMSLAGSPAQQPSGGTPAGSAPFSLPFPFPFPAPAAAGPAGAVALSFPGVPVAPLLPLPLPLLPPRLVRTLQPLVELTPEDVEALAVVQGIMQLLLRAMAAAAHANTDAGGDGSGDAAPREVSPSPGHSVSTSSAFGAARSSSPGSLLAPGASARGRSVGEAVGRAVAVSPTTVVATLADVRAATAELVPILPQVAPGLASTSLRLMAALRERAQVRLRRGLAAARASSASSAASSSGNSVVPRVNGGNRLQKTEPAPAARLAPPAASYSSTTAAATASSGPGAASSPAPDGDSRLQARRATRQGTGGASWWDPAALLGGGMRIAASTAAQGATPGQ